MELYGKTDKSIAQKIMIHVVEILLIWLSYWLLFQGGGYWLERYLHIHNAVEGHSRRVIIFTFSVILFFRLGYMMFFLLKRKMPWDESMGILFGFSLYYIGYPLFVLPTATPLVPLDYFAIALFFTGCILNSGGEILRAIWKKKPENTGKIYTGGFFSLSRHINYFGDLLWVTAYALVTRNWYSASVPVFLFCLFAFYNAPKLDRYLKTKYGKGYDDYAKKTKMLIPFIY